MTDKETLVEEEEQPAKTELSAEQKRARRRGLAQQAVALAMEGQWEASTKVNRQILDMFPDDPEASNRLGNALSELNRVPEAIEAYENTVRSQPTNVIAQRNLVRLRKIADAGDVGAKPSQKLQSSFFIEEVGKTGITSLGELAPPETMVRVTAGDEVHVEEQDGKLIVKMTDGTYLGTVESHLAERLSRLMSGGNKYQAGVVMAEGSRLRILIREVFQSPEQEGRISFPPKTGTDVRAYTRESLLRRGEDDDEVEEESADVEADDIDDEDENPAEFGFSETSLASDS